MSKWVKVSERLPTREDADEQDAVWGWADDGQPVEPIYWEAIGTAECNVTHWMPKPCQQPPAPPKEKDL
jgi:hypothetical protein